jgi:hypothetical protein
VHESNGFKAALCGAASAVILTISPALAKDPGQLMIGAGVFGLDSDHDHLFEAQANYRFGWGFFGGDGAFRGFKPIIGGMVNADGGFMGYAGLAAPFQFGNGRWEIQPWAAVGGYHRGDGIDLGGTFQFHLGLGASYAVSSNGRIGVAWTHISNANIHDENPGVNSILVTWTWMFRD